MKLKEWELLKAYIGSKIAEGARAAVNEPLPEGVEYNTTLSDQMEQNLLDYFKEQSWVDQSIGRGIRPLPEEPVEIIDMVNHVNNEPEPLLPPLHIRIVKFRGKNGGFAIKEQDMYRVEIVKDLVPMLIAGGGYDYSERYYAMQRAQPWADFLGIPILDASEHRDIEKKPALMRYHGEFG